MISSRVQFGVYGAVIPILLVCMMYVGFSASGTVLAGQAVGQLLHVTDWLELLFWCGDYRHYNLWLSHHSYFRKVASVIGVITFFIYFSVCFI